MGVCLLYRIQKEACEVLSQYSRQSQGPPHESYLSEKLDLASIYLREFQKLKTVRFEWSMHFPYPLAKNFDCTYHWGQEEQDDWQPPDIFAY